MQRIERSVLGMCLVFVLSACTVEEDGGFCKTHPSEHWEHREHIPRLRVELREDLASATLHLPGRALVTSDGGDPERALHEAGNLLVPIETAGCGSPDPEVDSHAEGWRVRYRLQCESDIRLRQLAIPVLERLSALDEVEVDITTPAVNKRFLVHRQCDAALYNFAKPGRQEP